MALKVADKKKFQEMADKLQAEGPMDEAHAEVFEAIQKFTKQIEDSLDVFQEVFGFENSTQARTALRNAFGSLQYRKMFGSSARRTASSITMNWEEFIKLYEEKGGKIKAMAEELQLAPLTVSKFIDKRFIKTLRRKPEGD